ARRPGRLGRVRAGHRHGSAPAGAARARRRRPGRHPEPDQRRRRGALAGGAVRGRAVRAVVRAAGRASHDAAVEAGGRRVDLGLEGRVALVTGGSKGIGRAIAAALAAEGAKVALTSRDAGRAEQAAAATGARGYAFDSGDLDAIPQLLDSVTADLG